MFDFDGKHVLVTGATSGIGCAIARAFSFAGAEVLAVGLPPEEHLPAPIRAQILDVTDTAAVEEFIGGLRDSGLGELLRRTRNDIAYTRG